MKDMPAVSGEEMAFAMAVGSLAAAGKIPGSGVGGFGTSIETESQHLALTDIPSNRGMMAIRGQFPSEKFQPIMMRIWALAPLLDDPGMAQFVRPASDGDGEEMHGAVYEVAGTMPLNAKGEFNRNTFFRRVKTLWDEDVDVSSTDN